MRNVSDELFARPSVMKVFVSSRMRGGVLDAERNAAVEAIDQSGFARAWAWERDAMAGPYSSEGVCLGHARTSDGLILILAGDLTHVTHKEYKDAFAHGVPCFILLKEGVARQRDVRDFIRQERDNAITVNFRNLSELQTQITNALKFYSLQLVRREIFKNRRTRSRKTRI